MLCLPHRDVVLMQQLLLLRRGQHRLPIPRRRTRCQLSLHRPELGFQLRTATHDASELSAIKMLPRHI